MCLMLLYILTFLLMFVLIQKADHLCEGTDFDMGGPSGSSRGDLEKKAACAIDLQTAGLSTGLQSQVTNGPLNQSEVTVEPRP